MVFHLDVSHAVLPHLTGSFAVASSGDGGNAAGNHGGGGNGRGEATRAAPAITAEETATAMVQVQAAMDMARPGTMQAVQARTPSLA
jgi:hypothetical protein